jgi:hypothetical protein
MKRVAYAAVVAASVGASFLTAHHAANDTRTQVKALAFKLATATREAQIRGCQRGAGDRRDSVLGWTRARASWRVIAHDDKATRAQRENAAATVAVYNTVIAGFKSRIVDCDTAYPRPSEEPR